MSYEHLVTDGERETNQERNARLQAEYDAYVSELKAKGAEPTNYGNWLSSKKHTENG